MSDPHAPRASQSDPSTASSQSAAGDAAVGLRTLQQGKIPRTFGRYRILDRLGRGGMGAVFRAHDSQLDRVVALKVPFLRDEDAGLRERFYREARAAAALHHANICPVYDVGEFQGIPYLTMAFVEGRSLAAALESGQTFSPTQAAHLVRKLALAMQAAHARGVIHRDLKPANVILRPDGEPVIMDFGLARRGEDTQGEGLTRKGDVIGTIEYMSPEQFEGDNEAVGPTSDVYALGVVLYELLTGRRPFAGGTASTVAAIILKPPPRPGELRPGVPSELEDICLKAMAKLPADRYPTMALLAGALTAFLRSHQSGVASAAARSAAAGPTPTPADTRPVRDTAVPRKRGDDPGWELVEDPPAAPASPPPAPRSVVRAKLVKPRKKARSNSNLLILISIGIVGICVSLILGAIILRSGGDRPATTSPSPSAPASPAPSNPAPPPPTTMTGPSGNAPARSATDKAKSRPRRGKGATDRR